MTTVKNAITLTSPKVIQGKVDRAAELDKGMGEQKSELDGLKDELIGFAINSKEMTISDKGVPRVEWAAFDGSKVRVSFPGPGLVSTTDKPEAIAVLRKLAGKRFDDLFEEVKVIKIKDAKKFRELAKKLLNGAAKPLIKAVTKAANPSVSFETKSQAH